MNERDAHIEMVRGSIANSEKYAGVVDGLIAEIRADLDSQGVDLVVVNQLVALCVDQALVQAQIRNHRWFLSVLDG